MSLQYVNGFSKALGAPVAAIDTTVELEAGAGALLPNAASLTANPMRFVLREGTIAEVVEATSIAGDVLTVTRAVETIDGLSTAQAFALLGTVVENSPTKETLDQFALASINTGDQTITSTSDATSHTVALSASGGSLQLVEGTNITLTTTGTAESAIVTIAAAGGAGIGGSITAQAGGVGHVAFAATSTDTIEGEANLVWDKTNNRLGIGTAAPSNPLHVVGTSLFTGVISSPGAGAGSERFGLGSTAGASSAAFGPSARATGIAASTLGIGSAGHNYAVSLGGATTNSDSQVAIGDNSYPCLDVFLGHGPTSANASLATLSATLNASGSTATSDRNAMNLKLNGGRSTGTGVGGSVQIQTSPSGSTGTSQNALTPRMYQSAKHFALTDSVSTKFLGLAIGTNNKHFGAKLVCTISATDATEYQCVTYELLVNAVAKGSAVTTTLTDNTVSPSAACSSGTLTCTFSSSTPSAYNVDVNATAVSSLAGATIKIQFAIVQMNSDYTITVTPS